MKILVTGGAGFIGWNLVEAFLRGGHNVVIPDNFDEFYNVRVKQHTVNLCRQVAEDTNGTYELIKGDVRDPETVNRAVAGTNIVVHQPA